MRRLAALVLIAVTGACTPIQPIPNSPFSDGQKHTEPVFYNGKNYNVTFQYLADKQTFQITVAGKARALRGRPGDREVVETVAGAALNHFACPGGQKGKVISGTSRHDEDRWQMLARCA